MQPLLHPGERSTVACRDAGTALPDVNHELRGLAVMEDDVALQLGELDRKVEFILGEKLVVHGVCVCHGGRTYLHPLCKGILFALSKRGTVREAGVIYKNLPPTHETNNYSLLY